MPDAGSTPDITGLLRRWQNGDAQALADLTPLVYRGNHTLQSTALVHEAFLRLVDQNRVDWQSRTHFFGVAAQLMRRILVGHARRVGRAKRGADVVKISLDEGVDVAQTAATDPPDILMLDAALQELEALDVRQARIVELRFFAGLTIEETADAMQVSTGTIKREWAVARAWLYRRIAARPE